MKSKLFKKSIISINDLEPDDIDMILKKADEMEKLVLANDGDQRFKGKILAALFFEPSSRTFSSFITAMQKLGGGIIPLNRMDTTSVAKGETLEDTVRVFSNYADLLVIRHSEPGSVELADKYATAPVLNAGDGINEHPTQALIDFYTIRKKFPNRKNLHILMIGDLAHYRPTNSLMKLLSKYKEIKISLATPKKLKIQNNLRKFLKEQDVDFEEHETFDHLLSAVDVLYVTRVKKEYMGKKLYMEVKGSYIVDKNIIKLMKKNAIIMHCLPRIDEIHPEVDNNPRSVYFGPQIRNGLYVRMALIDLILSK